MVKKLLRHVFIVSPTCLALTGCFPGPGFFEQTETGIELVSEVKTVVEGDRTIAVVSASSNTVQKIRASAELEGVELSIPPGSLGIDMSISLEESSGLASGKTASKLGVSFGNEAGRAVNLSNDRGVLELPPKAAPMTLQLPLGGAGLMLNSSQTDDDVLVTFMRQELGNGDCLEQIFPPELFTFQNQRIQIAVRRFGAYQPLKMPKADLEKLQKDNSQQNGLISIVREGCRIVTKSEQRSLPPVSISFTNVRTVDRVVQLNAKVEGEDIDRCYLVGRDSISGRNFEQSASRSSFQVDFSKSLAAVDARFLIGCDLLSGRNVETSFRRVQIEARQLIIEVSYDNRSLKVQGNLKRELLKDCNYLITNKAGSPIQGKVNNPENTIIDLSQIGEVNGEIRYECKASDSNQVVKSNQVTIYLPPFASSQPQQPDLPGDPEGPGPDPDDPNQPPGGDYYPISLMGLSVSPSVASAGSFLQLTAHIASEYQIHTVCAWAESDLMTSPFTWLDCWNMTMISPGIYQASIYLPTYLRNEKYLLTQLKFIDMPGHAHYFHSYPTVGYYYHGTPVNVAHFDVYGGTADVIPPVVTQLNFPQSSLEAGNFLHLTVNITDNDSGVEDREPLCILLRSVVYDYHASSCAYLQHETGNTYSAFFYTDIWLPSDIYYLADIYFRDRAGNILHLHAYSHTGYFEGTALNIPSIQISGDSFDNAPPMLMSLNTDQSSYFAGNMMTITVEAVDESGVSTNHFYCWQFTDPMEYHVFDACPTSIVALGGNYYEFHFPLPAFIWPGEYLLSFFPLVDNQGNLIWHTWNGNHISPSFYEAPSVSSPYILIME